MLTLGTAQAAQDTPLYGDLGAGVEHARVEMLSGHVRRLIGRLSRLCNEVMERPHDHVARERLFSAIEMTLAHLAKRKRPWKHNEISVLLLRMTAEAEAVREGISTARSPAPLDGRAAFALANSVRNLDAILSLLRQSALERAAP